MVRACQIAEQASALGICAARRLFPRRSGVWPVQFQAAVRRCGALAGAAHGTERADIQQRPARRVPRRTSGGLAQCACQCSHASGAGGCIRLLGSERGSRRERGGCVRRRERPVARRAVR